MPSHVAELLAMLFSVLLMKLFAMTIGYRIVKLGYDALVRGIKGEFDFGGKVTGKVELKLLSASPGLFFVLLGSAIIIWAIAVEKPIKFSMTIPSAEEQAQTSVEPEPDASASGPQK